MTQTQLGEAFVPIRATLDKLDGDLAAARGKIENALGAIGGNLQKIGTLALTGLAAAATTAATAIVGIGAAAYASGLQLDSAFDTILTKTGATGGELEDLKGTFRDVFGSIPTQAEPAADVIAALNQRLGLTGDALGDVAKPLLEMTRLLGGDATRNTELFTRVMGDWGIASEDAAGVLDRLFVAQQQTGVGVDALMQKVVQFGSPLRLMGFTLEDSIAVFGKWEQEGVNAELVMGSLRIAAGNFAKANRPLRESLLATFDSIKNNTDASEALAESMRVFGARAGPDMAAAIREGRFEFEDLIAVLGDADGAVLNTASATADAAERFTILKNRVTLALEPLGMALMDAATQILDTLMPALDGLLPTITSLAQTGGELVTNFIGRAIELMPTLQSIVQGLIDVFILGREPLGDWSTLWEKLAAVVGPDLAQTLTDIIAKVDEVIKPVVAWLEENVKLQDVLIALAVAIAAVVVPAIISVITAAAPIVAVFVGVIAVAALLRQAWEENWGGIQEKTAAVWAVVQPLFEQVRAWLAENLPKVVEFYSTLWAERWAQMQRVIEVVWPIVQTIFTAIRDFIVNTLVPTIANLYTQWTTVWWPQIETALKNSWTVIETVFKELDRWINTNIVPWIDFLRDKWANEVWPAIHKALTDAWAVIEPIWKLFKTWLDENLPKATEGFKDVFAGAMAVINGAIAPVKDLWDAFVAAVQGFWTWITNHTFSFKLNIPDLPDWAVPGSPLPIHTAWKAFAEDLNRMTIMPQFNMDELVPAMALVDDDGGRSISYSSVTTVNTNRDPMRVLRASRHLDKLGSTR